MTLLYYCYNISVNLNRGNKDMPKRYGYKCVQKDGSTFINRNIVCFSRKDARELMLSDKKIFKFCKNWEVIEL